MLYLSLPRRGSTASVVGGAGGRTCLLGNEVFFVSPRCQTISKRFVLGAC
jgi:hypothetical protein